MEYASGSRSDGMPLPPGVTAITDRNQKRASKTLSKAVSLHLEGKLEGAGRLLLKAIEDGERDPALYAALGHVQYEMRDYEAAAETYATLTEIDPKHRTASFHLGVCYGNLKHWKDAATAFQRACEADATRAESMLGLGITLIHDGRPAEALPSLEKYLSLHPDHEQALFMVRMEAEIFLQGWESFGGAAVVNQRDAQAQHALGARGVGLAGPLEGGRGVLPMFQIAMANAQVETRGAMPRI